MTMWYTQVSTEKGGRDMRLEGKVALITGRAAGIGRATAERFLEEGAQVVICDIRQDAGRAAVQELGSKLSFNRVDVTDRDGVQVWVDDVAAKFGHIDVLVNNAGILADATLVKVKDGVLVKQMAEADFDRVIAVNLRRVQLYTGRCALYDPARRRRGPQYQCSHGIGW
jgi:3-oxoacyl-[acyl-carrier protein] reductase